MKKKISVLYLSYDGMTDSLGQSQVLPYLKGLSEYDYNFEILSFDKPAEFAKNNQTVYEFIQNHNIHWTHLNYTKSPPIVSTLKDLYVGWKQVKKLFKSNHYEIVHCRGYIAAILGLRCKNKFASRFIFDMRGWWPDEKKESGLWNHFIFIPVYRYFKYLERKFFSQSDITVSLTFAGKNEIVNNKYKEESKVGVIPTCVDFDVFKPFDENLRLQIRHELNIPSDAIVLLYSGALGSNYNNEGIFKLYKILLQKHNNAHFLILSKDDVNYVNSELIKHNVTTEKVRVINSPFNEVYKYLMAGDIGVILYRKQFSAIGRSPTKLGEYWACGLPVISIKGLGDLDEILSKYPKGGILVDEVEPATVTDAFDKMISDKPDKQLLRTYAEDYFDIKSGVEKYRAIYNAVLNTDK